MEKNIMVIMIKITKSNNNVYDWKVLNMINDKYN